MCKNLFSRHHMCFQANTRISLSLYNTKKKLDTSYRYAASHHPLLPNLSHPSPPNLALPITTHHYPTSHYPSLPNLTQLPTTHHHPTQHYPSPPLSSTKSIGVDSWS